MTTDLGVTSGDLSGYVKKQRLGVTTGLTKQGRSNNNVLKK